MGCVQRPVEGGAEYEDRILDPHVFGPSMAPGPLQIHVT